MAVGDRLKISSDGLLRIGEASDDLWTPDRNGPPEGRSGITQAGDVWSLGMTLVEAMTQQAPSWDRTRGIDPAVPGTLPAPFFDIARRCLRSDVRSRISLAEISRVLQPGAPAPAPQVRSSEPHSNELRSTQARPSVAAVVPTPKPRPSVIPALPIPRPAMLMAGKRKYRFPLAAAILGGLIVSGAILTRVRSANTTQEIESKPPVQSELVPAEQKPSPVAVRPVVGEVPPDVAAKTSDALSSQPAASESAPSAERSADSPASGDVIDRVVPEIPAEILQTVRGRMRVSVRVTVDESGAVVDAELDSHPGSKYFDRKAVEAARRFKFKPSEAESTRLVRFEFRKDGCDVL
jgi:TonB family protein